MLCGFTHLVEKSHRPQDTAEEREREREREREGGRKTPGGREGGVDEERQETW